MALHRARGMWTGVLTDDRQGDRSALDEKQQNEWSLNIIRVELSEGCEVTLLFWYAPWFGNGLCLSGDLVATTDEQRILEWILCAVRMPKRTGLGPGCRQMPQQDVFAQVPSAHTEGPNSPKTLPGSSHHRTASGQLVSDERMSYRKAVVSCAW